MFKIEFDVFLSGSLGFLDSAMVLNSCFWLVADLELIYIKHYFSSRIISMLMSFKVDLF